MSTPTLGYWDLRGLCAPIRLLLNYAQVNFNDKRYQFDSNLETLKKNWLADRDSLGLEFPNLPYYIDGNVKLTQSSAILRYLGRKHKLAGQNDEEQAFLEMLEHQALDLKYEIFKIAYNENFEKMKADFVKTLPDRLKLWSDFFNNKQFVLGDRISYADFAVYEALDIAFMFEPEVFVKYGNLKQYLERIEKLPTLAKYFDPAHYSKFPLMAPMARWGGKREQ